MEDSIEEDKPDIIYFTASGGSRVRLYNTILNKIPRGKYQVIIQNFDGAGLYVLYKK